MTDLVTRNRGIILAVLDEHPFLRVPTIAVTDIAEKIAALEAAGVSSLVAALERIAGMTDIEADFDGFEARDIARAVLSKGDGG